MGWSSCCCCLLTFGGTILAQTLSPAQGPQTPLLGYVTSDSPVSVRPIVGAPGAVVVGDAIPLPGDVTRFVLAPGQRFGIVERAGASELGILPLSVTESGTSQPLPGTSAHMDSIAFSPSGTAAVVYSAALQQAQVLTGMPSAGQISQSFDLTPLNGVPVTSLAVSDDAQAVLMGVSDGTSGAVWSLAPGQPAQQLVKLGVPSAIRFFAGKQDAVVADQGWQQVSLLSSVVQQFNSRLLAGSAQGVTVPSDVEISTDQQQVWVADGSGNLLNIDLNSGATTSTDSPVLPARLTRLSGKSLYLITSPDSTSSGLWAPATSSSPWKLLGAGK